MHVVEIIGAVTEGVVAIIAASTALVLSIKNKKGA